MYGLRPGDFEKLMAFQGGKCFICHRAYGKTRRLCVDHDHATGKVRGLLCKSCNTIMGRLRDDPATWSRGHDYLITPPYGMLLRTEELDNREEEQ